MLQLGIDEFTLVLKLRDTSVFKGIDWEELAEDTIANYINEALSLEDVFGIAEKTNTGNVQGYTIGYVYGTHPFYFRVCYHNAHFRMGITVRFSAQSWLFYKDKVKKNTGEHIDVPGLLRGVRRMIDKDMFDIHLSRIDIYADYINEHISVDSLQQDLTNGLAKVYFNNCKQNRSNLRFINENNITDTLYIGSMKKNTQSIVRIYNKRKEQISKGGVHYDTAINCEDWVRFENEIHHDYAKDITKQLLTITSQKDLNDLIAKCLLNKYYISYGSETSVLDNPHVITQILTNALGDCNYYYTRSNYKDMNLSKNLNYITKNSGLIPFLYKCTQIDSNSLQYFFEFIGNKVNSYTPNDDCCKWLRCHLNDYDNEDIERLFKPTKKGNKQDDYN